VKGTKTRTSKKEGRESKNPDTTGSKRAGGRGSSGVPGERDKERWRDSDVGMRREKQV
jgi:hypothetical protein